MRTTTPAEQLYIAGQNIQIVGQTGDIDYLRANIDADDQVFSKRRKATEKT